MSTNSSPETFPGKNNKQWGFTFEDFDRIFFSHPTNIHVEGPSISKLLRGI